MSESQDLKQYVRRAMKHVAENPENVEEETALLITRLRRHDIRVMHEVLEELRHAVAEDSANRIREAQDPRPKRRRPPGVR